MPSNDWGESSASFSGYDQVKNALISLIKFRIFIFSIRIEELSGPT